MLVALLCLPAASTFAQVGAGGEAGVRPPGTARRLAAAPVFDAHLMTRDPRQGTGCSRPVPASAFFPTDAQAYVWMELDDVVPGTVVTAIWTQPDGTPYESPVPFTPGFTGFGCAWFFISIAGQPPASRLGTWSVQVTMGNASFRETFSILAGNLAVTSHLMTRDPRAGSGCAIPVRDNRVLPTDPRIFLWLAVANSPVGQTLTVDWFAPSGTLYTSFTLPPTDWSGAGCFWSDLTISGAQAAQFTGTWTVRATLPLVGATGRVVLADSFDLGAPSGPATAGEPRTIISLQPGFYVAEAQLAGGEVEGVWGMEVLTSRGRAEGGFNLGGLLKENGEAVSFGGFLLAEPMRVTVTVNAQVLPGQTAPLAMEVRLLDSNRQLLAAASGGTQVQLSRDLNAGFHIIEIQSTPGSPRAAVQIGLAAPYFSGGVVVGGFIGSGVVGFGAFYVPEAQDVTVRLFNRNTYPRGAGNLVLTLVRREL